MPDKDQPEAERGTRDHLSRLTRERRAELGLSLAKVVAASNDPDINIAWINRLEHNLIRQTPDIRRLEALARGLRLPVRLLQEATAAQFLGLDMVESPSSQARVIVAHFDSLSQEDQDRFMQILEIWGGKSGKPDMGEPDDQ